MFSFARERLSDLWGEMGVLLKQHWAEVAHYKDIPLSPKKEFYEAAERGGALRLFTARQEGVLVGYAAFFVLHHPHYKECLVANQDVLFLTPEVRGKKLGACFIRWCDEQLKTEGVQVVTQHVKAKPELDFGPLLEGLGYELMDKIYTRRLDKEQQ